MIHGKNSYTPVFFTNTNFVFLLKVKEEVMGRSGEKYGEDGVGVWVKLREKWGGKENEIG